MNKNPLNTGLIAKNFTGNGPVTRAMVHARTKELALIAGRIPPEVSQVDYQQAQRELAGEAVIDLRDRLMESLPESKRWDPAPGTEGYQAPDAIDEDEDAEGWSESEQLAEEGEA
jgi:hypothetical protein